MWFRVIYSLLWALALPFVFLRLWLRGRVDPRYRADWAERLALNAAPEPPDLWIHAVSVGEARACIPIVKALIAKKKRLLITCTTPTGRATLRELFGSAVSIRYLPFDAPFLMRKFLRSNRPQMGLLMETEVWPGLCHTAYHEQIPLWLVNARMSEKSARGYSRGGSLTQAMFGCLYGVAAQSQAHADRFAVLGAHNIHVIGNLKFDLSLPDDLRRRADTLTEHLTGGVAAAPYWVAGATRAGEEASILNALVKHPLRQRAKAIIVPRHADRWGSTYTLAVRLGFNVARRSDSVISPDCEVIVGDSMGEMLSYYANARVAVMGGTFGGTGGQNLIEPCAIGVPVVLGPSIYNFREAADEALKLGAAKRVSDPRDALTVVLELLDNESHRKLVAAQAEKFVASHRGATIRTLAILGV